MSPERFVLGTPGRPLSPDVNPRMLSKVVDVVQIMEDAGNPLGQFEQRLPVKGVIPDVKPKK